MAALTLYRVIFILIFREEIGDAGHLRSLLAALLTGLRFDAQAATYWMLAPLAASLLCLVEPNRTRHASPDARPHAEREEYDSNCHAGPCQRAADRVRAVTGLLFAFATPLISVVAVQYYREYHDVFDQMLFHAGDDDTGAIVATLYHGYNLIACLTLAAVLGGLGVLVGKRWAITPAWKNLTRMDLQVRPGRTWRSILRDLLCRRGNIGPLVPHRWTEKGTVRICRDQPSVGARPPGASHKWGLSPFSPGWRGGRSLDGSRPCSWDCRWLPACGARWDACPCRRRPRPSPPTAC